MPIVASFAFKSVELRFENLFRSFPFSLFCTMIITHLWDNSFNFYVSHVIDNWLFDAIYIIMQISFSFLLLGFVSCETQDLCEIL